MKTAALQKELDNERGNQARLGSEIGQLQAQLREAKNGLMAAARLNDQLELNQLTIDKLNNESKLFYPIFLSTPLSQSIFSSVTYLINVCAIL